MATRGDGLYDNDRALEVLDDLSYAVKLEESATHFAAGLGLLAWLIPRSLATDSVKEEIEDGQRWMKQYSPEVRARLTALSTKPSEFIQRKSRSAELLAILGPQEDGPREDVLLKIPGGDKVMEELAEECNQMLERGASDWADVGILPGELAVLGPLLELRAFGIKPPRDEVEHWRESFTMAVLSPSKRHGASDEYLDHVRKAFALLEGK